MSLQEKVALVTGATDGIGRAAAEKLGALGVRVSVCGRDQERGEETVSRIVSRGGQAVFIRADLLDPETPSMMVEKTIAHWGGLDILINNAATVCNKRVEDISHDDWNRLFAVNLKSPFFTIQAALPLLKQSRGNVINVSSINAIKNGVNNVVYDSLKAALNHMSRGLAKDLHEQGVRINVLMPGGTRTSLLYEWFGQQIDDPEALKEKIAAVQTEKRMADPDFMADAIAFLADDDKSGWINGAAIPIDGGLLLKS
ncbi:Enoyl-(Acyl carrier protein) reductase [Paenibacillus sp. 1_12]|uniref:SDR family NAD(P)-dependent oxidoreductase n=1 Tax=Paenibacillus sp. 1_12 TaxID=1566278 RepID=UPI0008E85065|nr:SDR family oxidoreductase [Paenibacillus sp. 1_12]SFM46020.1 Enoyl-(Acyl carrier protein) reductase [Paenibacillus sp. 1_12]